MMCAMLGELSYTQAEVTDTITQVAADYFDGQQHRHPLLSPSVTS